MRPWSSVLILLLAFAFLPARLAAEGTGEVRVGILAYQGSERAAREWEPTIVYLERALPGRHVTMAPFDLAGLTAAVAAHQVDFVITNPGHYVTLEADYGVTRIATVEDRLSQSPTAAVGSTVIARRERAYLVALGDLKGKRLAIVSRDGFGGFQILWREMSAIGLDPFSDLADLYDTGFPMDRVVWAVRDGTTDAGVLRSCHLEALIRRGVVAADEFRVVGEHTDGDLACRHSSRLYPDWPFARLATTPRDLAKEVAAALLTMPPADGQAWTAPLDYSEVHELFRTLQIGPYRRLKAPSLAELARRNWHWLVAAFAAVGWWIFHVARVEALVRRRTAQLVHEMAERERAEDTAARHRDERDRLSRLGILGEMSSNIAHELNQPLAAIVNYANAMQRLLDAPQTDVASLREGAVQVADQAARAAAIIQGIRAFVRRRPPSRSPIEINAVVGEAVALFSDVSGRRKFPIHLHLAEGLPPVQADKVEIEQVLLNLLQNAVDAMGGPGGALTIRTSQADGMVKVAVRDSGPPISPEAEARLFEPFFTTKPEGLGLGLSICRTIIESHGGRLWAATNDGPGLTMRFTLPAPPERPAS